MVLCFMAKHLARALLRAAACELAARPGSGLLADRTARIARLGQMRVRQVRMRRWWRQTVRQTR